MTSIFRRSMLPAWLTGGSHPPKAPNDAQVRDWIRHVKLPAATVEPVARVVEKALVRRTGKLDFSDADPNVLDRLPATLLARLAPHTRHLLLADGCPAQVAHRLIEELDVQEVSPASLMPRKWEAPKWEATKRDASNRKRTAAPRPSVPPPPRPTTAAAIRPGPTAAPAPAPAPDEVIYDVPRRRYDGDYDLPPRPRTRIRVALPVMPRPETPEPSSPERGIAIPYDVPPRRSGRYDVPRSQSSKPSLKDEIALQSELLHHLRPTSLADRTGIVQRAVEALRLPSAWLSVQENVEDPAARFSLPSDDATALSAAFRDLSADMMVPSLQMPFLVAKRLLAQRFPGKPLTLSADDVVHLIVAMRTVEQMVARISGKEPVLPPPRRGRSPAG